MGTRLASVVAALLLSAVPASAQRLPTIVTPEHYDLAFVVDLTRERFEGTETIGVRIAEPTTRIVLNAIDLQIRDVTFGAGSAAQKATVTRDEANQTATFTVPRPLAKGPSEIHVRFSGVLNHQLRGFYASEANGRKYAVTQFESTDARRAFPCFDEPAFKATFALTTTIDRGDTAISNGKVLSDVAGPSITQHTIKFATSPKMSSYLVAIAVGDFKCLEGGADSVPIRICATPDKKDLGHIALGAAQEILTFYSRYYSIKYPFGKLDVVAVPDFAAGAMENTAAIFYRETDLLADSKSASVATRKNIASILAHEMAHQWLGDLVTMQWWDDLGLNEGCATGRAKSATSGNRVERSLPTFVNHRGFPLMDVSVTCGNNRPTVTLKQQRFLLGSGGWGGWGGSGESGGSGVDKARWQVPVCVKTAGQQSPTCEVLSNATQTMMLPGSGCAPWVFANAGAQGYYRTAYSSEMLGAIAPRVTTDLTAPERLALIDDEWALVRAGRHSAADYLTLAAAYGHEHASGVLADVTNRLEFVDEYLTTDTTRARFDGFVRSLLRPLFDELGFEAGAADSDDRRVLRATVVEALGIIAEDADVIARSRAALDRSLSGGASLDPTLAGAVIRTAAAHGDAALFDPLAAAS